MRLIRICANSCRHPALVGHILCDACRLAAGGYPRKVRK